MFKRQADITPQVLTPVIRGNVAVAGMVMRRICRAAVLICQKQHELTGRPEPEAVSLGNGGFHGAFEKIPAVTLERCAVRIPKVAEHPDDTSLLRSPWKGRHSLDIRKQEQVTPLCGVKAGKLLGSDAHTTHKGKLQTGCRDGDIFHAPVAVAEGELYELDIVFFDVLENFFFGVDHFAPPGKLV